MYKLGNNEKFCCSFNKVQDFALSKLEDRAKLGQIFFSPKKIIGGASSFINFNSIMSLTLGAPPSSSTNTKAFSGLALTVNLTSALPVGRSALKLLGGISKVAEGNEKKVNEFPEDRIQIPVGITPQNLKNYTLYDVLGLTPEWADSADAEAIKVR